MKTGSFRDLFLLAKLLDNLSDIEGC